MGCGRFDVALGFPSSTGWLLGLALASPRPRPPRPPRPPREPLALGGLVTSALSVSSFGGSIGFFLALGFGFASSNVALDEHAGAGPPSESSEDGSFGEGGSPLEELLELLLESLLLLPRFFFFFFCFLSALGLTFFGLRATVLPDSSCFSVSGSVWSAGCGPSAGMLADGTSAASSCRADSKAVSTSSCVG